MTCSLAGISFYRSRTSYTMGEFYQLYLLMILLMRAGDIETNPGPNTQESYISEQEILQLSKEINHAYYHSLATSLGIKMEQHQDNHDAFFSVLMEWNARQQPPDTNKRELLAVNLQRIGLGDLSDKLRSGSLIQTAPYTSAGPTASLVEPMSPELIERCRKDFMHKYKTTLCRIRSDPLNPSSLVQLQEIYTNLALEEEDGRGTKELEYGDLLKLKVKERTPKRFLIQGEAGAGKTTLCAKIAWDWMNGAHYQQFVWLLIVPLRESEDYTMGEIAKSYLQEDNPTTAAQLTHYIRSNPDNVLTVYDGLDEFKGKLRKKRRNEIKDDASIQEPRKHKPTRHAGYDTGQKYSPPPGSHTQEASVYTHPDGFNKESGAQQTPGKAKTQRDEHQKLGEVTQFSSGFSKNTCGDFTQRTDDYTEQADVSEAYRQPKGFPEGQSIHSNQQVGFNELPRPSTAHSGLQTMNQSPYTQHHDPEFNNSELIIEDIICCDQLKTSVVLITTRPWKAREIRGDADIRREYAFIRVDGFTEENMSSYIHKYFAKDVSRANDLIEFIKDNDVVSESMARYPIFVAMLCLMWKEIKIEKKQTIRSLQTYSQFFGEMVMFLKEHYVQKITDDLNPSSLDRLINETSVLLKPIAELAFTGLLENTLIFEERHFQDCHDSKTAACRVGILSQENRIAPVVGREERNPRVQSTVFFPHKLFQEYMAGVHLASLHDSDHKGYTRLMKEVVLPGKENFKYLLYFTASQNKTVGISVMTHMIQGLEERTDFLVDVAFECNDPDVVAVVQHNTMPERNMLHIDSNMTSHTIAGYATVGVDVIDLHIARSCGKTVSRDVGRIICASALLNELAILSRMHDNLFDLLAKESQNVKVSELCLEDIRDYEGDKELSSSASRDLAEALCSMPHLNDLTLKNTLPHDDFFSEMKEKASNIKVTRLSLEDIHDCAGEKELSSSASRDLAEAVCSMPHLNDLTLKNTHPHDDFYSVMKEKASNIKVTILSLWDIRDCAGDKELSSSASRDLAEAVCSMPHLNDLILSNTSPHDDFYSVMKEKALHIKITTLYLEDIPDYEGSKELSSSASRDLAEALCSILHLNYLTLNNVHPHDDFYSVMKEKALHIKITALYLEDIPDYAGFKELSSSASRDLAEALCSMPHLNDLTLNNTHLHDDSFSVMKEKASNIKGCFPQVAEGHFMLNGFTQLDIHSLLNSFKEFQGIESSDESSDYSKEETDNRHDGEEETHSSAEEEKGNSESGDEKKTGYSDPADEESKASYEDELEDDPKEHEERYPEQSEEKTDDVRNDNKWTEYIKEGNYVEGLFDHQGGELSLETLGCILHIPPGALEEESPTKITLEVLTELPDDLELEEDEMVVSPGFKCLPSGLHFKKPVKLIMPHCAVLSDPGKVKTVLHSWSHQTGKVERILQTAQTCRVHHNHFELTLEHFCRRYLTMFWDWLFARGKLMCFMPYLPYEMPSDRKPLMPLRLENKPKYASTYTKGRFYQPALDKAEEIMIERKDLTVNCEHDDKTQTKIIERGRLFSTTSCTAFFELDLQDKDENTGHARVRLKLTQTMTQEAMFDTGCIAPFEASKRHKDAFPEQACAKRKVSEKELLTLSKRIESSRYLDVGINLEIQHAELKDIKEGQSNRDALMDVFMKWRVKQPPDTDIRSILADKLEEAGLQELSGKLRNGTLVT